MSIKECHGTGTQAGDLAEATSVVRLLEEPRPKDRPLTISSIKPNVGHSEAASGVTSLIKGLLMLQHRIIPRHIGVKTRLNPKLPPLDKLNVVIPQTNMPFKALSKDSKRRMLVNNFNATGGITAMLLEEHLAPTLVAKDIRQHYPITLSAASPMALAHSKTRLLDYLKSTSKVEISHLSYTLTARRLHQKHRFACVASSAEELIHKLQTELQHSRRPSKHAISAFGVLVFTGQASSYSGMANILFKTNSTFRSHLLHSEAICQNMGLPSFVELINDDKADKVQFNQTQWQLALVALEIAIASLLQSWGIRPKAVIGHSLGEYSALCVAGVLSLADTLYLVGKRGLLLESACKSNDYSMATVSLPCSEVEMSIGLSSFSGCEIACINAPDQTVVSGPYMAIESLIAHFKANSVRVSKLRTLYAFHSKQMEAILTDFRHIAGTVPIKEPSLPLVSTLLGEVVQEAGSLDVEYLCRQIREPVRFWDALSKVEGLTEGGQILTWIEVGPGPACLPMIASTIQAKPAHLLSVLDPKKPNWLTISDLTAKYYSNNGNVRWDEYHKEYLNALSLLQLPSYPFDLKKYWIQYDGDWVIRKNTMSTVQPQAVQAVPPALESSTLHRLVSDSVDKGIRKLLFACSLSAEALESMIGCHRINGQSGCLSSIYVDMALAAASYLHKNPGLSSESPVMQVSALEVCSELDLCSSQSLKVIALQRPSDTNIVEISISPSIGNDAIELVRCKVVMGNGQDWAADANSNAYLYQSRMDLLNLFLNDGQVSRLSRSEVYQNFSSFVTYGESFQGIQEVLLHLSGLEAVAKITLRSKNGVYVCNPHWLDTFMQVPSLVVNCGHGCTARARFTCRGWNKMHILLPLEPGTIYRVHVRMQLCGQTTSMFGDLHVFDERGRAAVVIKQIHFRPVPASELNKTPPPPSGTVQTKGLDGSADNAHGSVSQRPIALRANGMSVNGPPAPETSKFKGNGHYTAVTSHSLSMINDKSPGGIMSGVLEDKNPHEPPQPSRAVNGDIYDKSPTFSSTQAQVCKGKALDGGSGAAIKFEEILAVIADETGVELDELDDDVLLGDLGIDSIIQLSLIARMEEYLAKPLPASLFLDFDSIAGLRLFFSTH